MKSVICGLILALSAIYPSCSTDTINSKDVSETQVYRSYSVSHDAGKKTTYVNAQFRVGGVTGTTLRLTNPSTVTVSGASLLLQDAANSIARTIFTGTYYSLTKNIDKPDESYLFSWTKHDGSKIDDPATMAAPVKATNIADGAEIKKSQDLDVTVDRGPVDADDSITIIISLNDTSNTSGSSSVLSKSARGRTIHFGAADLQKLANGAATLTVKHETHVRLAKSNQSIGGSIITSYTTSPITIKIIN